MPEIYRNASIFVLPTVREPFGLAFLEAMAYTLPCIGTDIEAVPEIIDDGKTGFVIPVNDYKILAERIIYLLNNPEIADNMGSVGQQKITSFYNWERVAAQNSK